MISMNKYNFYSVLFSLIGGLTIGQLFGYWEGLIVSILLGIYSYWILKPYECNNILKEEIKFTR